MEICTDAGELTPEDARLLALVKADVCRTVARTALDAVGGMAAIGAAGEARAFAEGPAPSEQQQRVCLKALVWLERAAQADPWHTGALRDQARLLLFLGNRVSEAFDICRTVTGLCDDDLEAHVLAGRLGQRLNRLGAAVQHWARVVELDPAPTDEAYFNLGLCRCAGHLYGAAIASLSRVSRMGRLAADAQSLRDKCEAALLRLGDQIGRDNAAAAADVAAAAAAAAATRGTRLSPPHKGDFSGLKALFAAAVLRGGDLNIAPGARVGTIIDVSNAILACRERIRALPSAPLHTQFEKIVMMLLPGGVRAALGNVLITALLFDGRRPAQKGAVASFRTSAGTPRVALPADFGLSTAAVTGASLADNLGNSGTRAELLALLAAGLHSGAVAVHIPSLVSSAGKTKLCGGVPRGTPPHPDPSWPDTEADDLILAAIRYFAACSIDVVAIFSSDWDIVCAAAQHGAVCAALRVLQVLAPANYKDGAGGGPVRAERRFLDISRLLREALRGRAQLTHENFATLLLMCGTDYVSVTRSLRLRRLIDAFDVVVARGGRAALDLTTPCAFRLLVQEALRLPRGVPGPRVAAVLRSHLYSLGWNRELIRGGRVPPPDYLAGDENPYGTIDGVLQVVVRGGFEGATSHRGRVLLYLEPRAAAARAAGPAVAGSANAEEADDEADDDSESGRDEPRAVDEDDDDEVDDDDDDASVVVAAAEEGDHDEMVAAADASAAGASVVAPRATEEETAAASARFAARVGEQVSGLAALEAGDAASRDAAIVVTLQGLLQAGRGGSAVALAIAVAIDELRRARAVEPWERFFQHQLAGSADVDELVGAATLAKRALPRAAAEKWFRVLRTTVAARTDAHAAAALRGIDAAWAATIFAPPSDASGLRDVFAPPSLLDSSRQRRAVFQVWAKAGLRFHSPVAYVAGSQSAARGDTTTSGESDKVHAGSAADDEVRKGEQAAGGDKASDAMQRAVKDGLCVYHNTVIAVAGDCSPQLGALLADAAEEDGQPLTHLFPQLLARLAETRLMVVLKRFAALVKGWGEPERRSWTASLDTATFGCFWIGVSDDGKWIQVD